MKVVKEFNKFIEKWCGSNFPHLIDSDENDGERFRCLIREEIDKINTYWQNRIKNERIMWDNYTNNDDRVITHGELRNVIGSMYNDLPDTDKELFKTVKHMSKQVDKRRK